MKSRTIEEQFGLDQSLYLIVTLYPFARDKDERRDMLKQFDSLVNEGADIFQVDSKGHSLLSLVDKNKSPALQSHINKEVDRRIAQGDYPPEAAIKKVPNMDVLLQEVEENFKLLDKLHKLESCLNDFSANATGEHALSVISALLRLQFKDLSQRQRDSLLETLPRILAAYHETNPQKYKLLIDQLTIAKQPNALIDLHAKMKENDKLKEGRPSSTIPSSTANIAVGLNSDNAKQLLGEETRKRRDRSVAAAPPSPTHSPPTKKIAASDVDVVARQSRATSSHPSLDKILEILDAVKRDPGKGKGDLFLRLNKHVNEYNKQENAKLELVIPVVNGNRAASSDAIIFPLPPKRDYDAHKYAKGIAEGIKVNYTSLVAAVEDVSPKQEERSSLKK